MRQVCLFTGLLLLIASPALPQAMLEYAIAAAGGSAAGAAGKGVSDGLDKVIRQIEKQVTESSETQPAVSVEPAKPTTAQFPQAPANTGFIVQQSPGETAMATTPTATQTNPALISAPKTAVTGWTQQARAPVRPEPSLEEFSKVETGTTRTELVARLGNPSAKIVIPEDGQLREVYHYTGSGVHLGIIRLTDGTVSIVEVDPMAK